MRSGGYIPYAIAAALCLLIGLLAFIFVKTSLMEPGDGIAAQPPGTIAPRP